MSEVITTMLVSESHGSMTFDAVFTTSHSLNAVITEHPVEEGAPVSDHAYMDPVEISVEIGVSDVGYNSGSIAGSSGNRSVEAFNMLKELMANFEPVTLVTRFGSYEDMLISSISTDDDYTTMNALKASVIFRHVPVVQTSTVTIQQQTSSSKDTTRQTGQSGRTKSTPTKQTSPSTKGTSNVSAAQQLVYKVTGGGNKSNTSSRATK